MTQDPIKARIQELCPDVNTPDPFLHEVETVACKFINKVESGKAKSKETYTDMKHLLVSAMQKDFMTPLTLPVVLRAIQTSGDWYFSGVADNLLVFEQRSQYFYWDLTKNFDDQTPECKAFIGSLLNV